MVVSRSHSGDLLLAYLPDNPQIVLDLKGLAGSMHRTWFNPVNGRTINLDAPVMPGSLVVLNRPEGWEDAMLLLKPSASGATAK